MAITSVNGILAGTRQKMMFHKVSTRLVTINEWFTLMDQPGWPSLQTLAVGNTANGVVPTDATSGFPKITFSSGVGYLHSASLSSIQLGVAMIYDRLFHVGEISYVAGTTTLASQPSYSGRVPNSSYVGTTIWLEVVTAFVTGTAWSVVVTYTDQDGNAAASTPTIAVFSAANLTKGKLFQIPLAAGDCGVQKIESVIVTNAAAAMTAGGFNIFVARPLWMGRTDTKHHGFDHTLMPQVFSDSALGWMMAQDQTTANIQVNVACNLVSG